MVPSARYWTMVMLLSGLRSSLAEKSVNRAISNATMKATLTSKRFAAPASGSSTSPGCDPRAL